jgi:hypothetical protein
MTACSNHLNLKKMANTKNNIFMTGLSGTVGRQMTLTQKAGNTIVGKKRGSSSVPATDDQLDIRDKFKVASMYAKAAIQDPATKAIYTAIAKGGQSAYNVALADAFSAPEIKTITTAGYLGQPGDIISIRVVDFKVAHVLIVIITPDGVVIEQGNAVLPAGSIDWKYTATALNATLAGTRIVVTARDLPANETVKEALIA